jgi:ribosomal-protein-alanine N-acetyltransferase
MADSWQTSRLLIRRFRESDWQDLHELQGDPDATRFVGGVWTPEKTREVTKRIAASYESKKLEWFAVADRTTDRVLGACWLGTLNPKWADALNCGSQVELGYRFARRHWGQSYATEAARAMLARGFNELALSRTVAIVEVRNPASKRVLQKLGMKYVTYAQRDGVRINYYVLEAGEVRLHANSNE